MAIVRYFSGKLNLDDHPYRVDPGDYTNALNITKDAESDGFDMVTSNIVGNSIVGYELPNGANICIGARADSLRNRVIYFVFNSEGYHNILMFDKATRSISKIIESKTDSADIDILNFQSNYKINSIDIIYRDNEGDLLFFNDGYNPPRGFNIDLISSYIPIPAYAIRVAKMPPLDALLPVYDSDASVVVNNLKNKLFQFRYRWVYADGYKSTWSPFSKVQLPIDAYTLDVESDPARNNVIYLQVTGGPVDYSRIEISGRMSVGNTYGDSFLIDSLDRDDYSIPPGGTYNYKFLNDGSYPFLDQRESDLLFDYVPNKARAQVLANGNHLVYGAITDGYNPISRDNVNVQITSSLVDTVASGNDPANPTISTFQGVSADSYYVHFIIGPDVGEGCTYNIKFHAPVYGADDFDVDVTYTATALDDATDVANALIALISPQLGPTSSVNLVSTNKVNVFSSQNRPNAYPYDQIVISATAQIVKAGGSPTWKWNTKYRLGLLYFDAYGKTNGVVSFVSNDEDPNDFSFTTPDFNISNVVGDTFRQPRIPVVYASIAHLPPSWAVSYQWVRTPNQSVSSFLQYITCQVDIDANYIYLGIQNLYTYKEENTGFVPSYTFQSGDRVRILCDLFTSPPPEYSNNLYALDYEVLGIVERPVNGGENGVFLKVAKSLSSPAFGDLLLIEIYTPALRTNGEGQVFYEFGESYPIYTASDGIRYHVGEDQNQTADQPATFTFADGDVYYKFRNFYTNTLSIADIYQNGVMDVNYSDFWASSVNSNGRPNIIDPNAKEEYNPVLRRFGQAFQPGTNINNINRFYAEDFDEDIREYGDIMRMISWNNTIVSFQRFKIGRIPVYQQMTFNVDGSSNLILSSNLLNRIQYYLGEYGVGDVPESVAWNNSSIYGWDNNRGVCWRLSASGLDPISIQNKINNFSVSNTSSRGFLYKIYGVFSTYTNKYITAFAPSQVSPAKTLVWNEKINGFESFVSFEPEMMCCLNNLLITFKNGGLYTHDSSTYNNFYDSQFGSSIRAVFNDAPLIVKTYNDVSVYSSDIWEISSLFTNSKSKNLVSPQTSWVRASQFIEREGAFYAVLNKAINPANNEVVNGDTLKGNFISVEFSISNTETLQYINAASIGVVESPKNLK